MMSDKLKLHLKALGITVSYLSCFIVAAYGFYWLLNNYTIISLILMSVVLTIGVGLGIYEKIYTGLKKGK